ncbi:hypothetical protein HN51_052132 [Arachis hypogaea]
MESKAWNRFSVGSSCPRRPAQIHRGDSAIAAATIVCLFLLPCRQCRISLGLTAFFIFLVTKGRRCLAAGGQQECCDSSSPGVSSGCRRSETGKERRREEGRGGSRLLNEDDGDNEGVKETWSGRLAESMQETLSDGADEEDDECWRRTTNAIEETTNGRPQ